MRVKINGKEVKLKFGVKFCRSMDEVYKVDYNGLEFGMGVNLGFMNLDQRNPVGLANVIKAATDHEGFTNDEVDNAIDDYAEANDGLEQLFKDVSDAMGKSPTVKATVDHFQKNAKVKE